MKCTKSRGKQKLIDNLVISLVNRLRLKRVLLTKLTIVSESFWNEAICDGMISVKCRHTSSIRTRVYKFRTAIKTLGPLHTFVSWNP
jgi:hypothetical protein